MPESWSRVSVEQWGYACGTDEAAAVLVWPVRFKPAVTLLLVLLGLGLRAPRLLTAVGSLGLIGTFAQSLSWIDLLYNHAARRVVGAPPLGADPSVRRWMCGMADAFVLASGLALGGGHAGLALALGVVVVL